MDTLLANSSSSIASKNSSSLRSLAVAVSSVSLPAATRGAIGPLFRERRLLLLRPLAGSWRSTREAGGGVEAPCCSSLLSSSSSSKELRASSSSGSGGGQGGSETHTLHHFKHMTTQNNTAAPTSLLGNKERDGMAGKL